MDPDATLKEMRELIAQPTGPVLTAYERADRFDRLAELVEALDGWMVAGGFSPTAWQMAPRGARA